MIAIVDYEMGNLRSVQKALEKVGASVLVTSDPAQIKRAKKIVLPGVGALKPAMEKLQSTGLISALADALKSGKPFLGICLGLQLLFEKSDEGEGARGLGVLSGNVTRFTMLKVPHMGWNQVAIKNTECPLFRGVDNLSNVYFCHSYFVNPSDTSSIAALTDYGAAFASAVWYENIFGVQFHPEKSQDTGLKILKNFTEIAA